LSDEGSYYAYGHSLHQLALCILSSLDGHDYQFPIGDADRERGLALTEGLRAEPTQTHVELLHSFILPILYGRDLLTIEDDHSKWIEPLEGFMALHNLQEDGNFKPPNMVTQLFAQLHYHIRGTMLYEAHRTVKDFGNNIYKLSVWLFLWP
jgi:hypothetical protein